MLDLGPDEQKIKWPKALHLDMLVESLLEGRIFVSSAQIANIIHQPRYSRELKL